MIKKTKRGLFFFILLIAQVFATQCLNTECAAGDLACDPTLIALAYLYPPAGAQFVAAGASGSVYTSPDGYNWSANTGPGGPLLTGVVLHDGLYLAQGASSNFISSDGQNWISSTVSGSSSLSNSTYFHGLFITANFGGGPTLFYSSDGQNWNSGPSLAGMADFEGSREYKDRLYIVDSGGNIASSADGVNWTTPVGFGGSDSDSLATDGQALLISDDTDVYRSTDGQNFQSVHSFSTFSLSIVYGNGKFVVFGDNGGSVDVFESFDGVNWSKTANLGAISIVESTFGNGVFVALSSGGDICTSADAYSWDCRAYTPAPKKITFGYRETGLQEDIDGALDAL
ncbi:MAG: hypothetical protein KDK34_10380 [Leptospiraceae bacterium]|nr:hypothetical protein [Leptospiraceae bacterium]